MDQLNKLLTNSKIKTFFPKHRKCVLKVMLLLLQCIIRCRTVNLNKCKTEAGIVLGKTELNIQSVYVRFIRFFKIKKIDEFCLGITLLIIKLTDMQSNVYLALDRTNWKIGRKNINVLYIGLILPNGIFIPIMWELYNKRGNTSEEERSEFIKRFLGVWRVHKDLNITLLADREFIGKNWFSFLKKAGFSLVIRARWQDYWKEVSLSCGKLIPKLERYIFRKINKQGFFQVPITLNGQQFYYTVLLNSAKRKKKKDKWMVLITDKANIQWIKQSYPMRWSIEVFFYHCKTNGFNLEDLNLSKPLKAQLMMGVTALGYVLSIINALKNNQLRKVKKQFFKAKNKSYNRVSLFRLGYDLLKNSIHSLADFIRFCQDLILKNISFKNFFAS